MGHSLFFLLSNTTCLCFGLAETGCGLLDALELFCLYLAQGLNSRFESLFCFCSLLRFCFGLAADGVRLGEVLCLLVGIATCFCIGLEETGCGLLDALELFRLCLAQGLHSCFE